MTSSRVVAYIDGGARGNPGPAGYGVRIENATGDLEHELHTPIGVATNNVAEYRGLIAALSYLAEHGYNDALIRSDSQLLARQIRDVLLPSPRLQRTGRLSSASAFDFLRIRLGTWC